MAVINVTINGDTEAYRFDEEATLFTLKERFSVEEGIAPKFQTLFCMGYRMDNDDLPIKEILQDGETVNVAIPKAKQDRIPTNKAVMVVIGNERRLLLLNELQRVELKERTKITGIYHNTVSGVGRRTYNVVHYNVDPGWFMLSAENLELKVYKVDANARVHQWSKEDKDNQEQTFTSDTFEESKVTANQKSVEKAMISTIRKLVFAGI